MFTEERHRLIKDQLLKNRSINIEEIVNQFGVSAVTARKDLKLLESQNLLVRTHGGAILNEESATLDLPLDKKQQINVPEKMAIARKVNEFVQEGDIIILDNGSTSTFIARELKDRTGITIITNAINIAWELASSKIDLILIGGNLREGSFSLVGPIAETCLQNLTANKYFMSVDGVDLEFGFTTPNLYETRLAQKMMAVSQSVMVVTDYTKFGKRRMGVIAPVKAVQAIITNKELVLDYQKKISDIGVALHLV
jgi:DeoR family transcriptional regulator of aga operon